MTTIDRRSTLRFAAVFAAALVLAAPAAARAYVFSGARLVELMREYEKSQAGRTDVLWGNMGRFEGYVIGVCDASEKSLALPDSTSYDQVVAAVAKYLQGHPERWNLSAYELVSQALLASFPRR